MAKGTRYWWMKLSNGFMTSPSIEYLLGQDNGAEYVVLYQMLFLKTLNTSGRMANSIGEVMIRYDVEKIRRDCKFFSTDTIVVALELYKKLGLIYVEEDGVLTIADHDKYVGSETDYALQKRKQRENNVGGSDAQIPETCGHEEDTNVDKVVDIVHTEIRDKSIEYRDKKDISIKTNRKKETGYTEEFEEWWRVYPRNGGDKKASFNLYSKLLQEMTSQELLNAALNYRAECERDGREDKYIKQAKTFLGPGGYAKEYAVGAPESKLNGGGGNEYGFNSRSSAAYGDVISFSELRSKGR